MPSRFKRNLLDQLVTALTALRDEAMNLERQHAGEIAAAASDYRPSARNLLHYVGLRRHDLRDLQGVLGSLGLSSLGRLESHALASLDAVLVALHRVADRPMERPPAFELPVDFHSGPHVLVEHTDALLGPPQRQRGVRVMVTMPSEAADSAVLACRLVEAGMDVARINSAHDDPATWQRIIRHVREAEKAVGRSCKVMIDLAGPKLRTGALASDTRVLKVRPSRDPLGAVVAPSRIWLTPADAPMPAPDGVDAVLPIEGPALAASQPGDALEVQDRRWCRRKVRVVEVRGTSRLAEAVRTLYVDEGAAVRLRRKGQYLGYGRIVGLPGNAPPLLLRANDLLLVTRDDQPGRAARFREDGTVEPARIGCSLGEAFPDVRTGHRIFFDDGKIAAVVLSNDGDQIQVRITHAAARGSKLRPDKGINLPDSDLRLPALTAEDRACLPFVVEHADIVGLSFVRKPQDVIEIDDELARLGGEHLGVVIKVETRQAFENLPRILLASLRSPPVGVMVARGDLAIEVGFERMAEVQEEILWLCEAAHVPVIWATQVLESLAKTGSPSRAEVTDAAMGVRAECVMLNKGPYIVDTVRFLCGVLERMQAHQHKKRAMLRKLSVSAMTGGPPVPVSPAQA